MSEATKNEVRSPTMIEVERKFSLKGDCERKLLEVGAACLQQKSFEDSYYDTDSYDLTLADFWLRQREGQWELKSPPEHRDVESKSAQYAETSAADEILQKISAILKTRSLVSECDSETADQIAVFVKQCGLKPFAVFRTDRKTYTLDGGFHIDLDETDFGYRVGEIELTVEQDGDVAAALQKIDAVAEKLGFTSVTRVPGKMDAYLQKHNVAHYEKLVQALVLYEK
ncbi:thiamine-triphosphatase-like [Glandiceps talaboti]